MLMSLLSLLSAYPAPFLESWSKTASDAVVVCLVLGVAVRARSRGAGSRSWPRSSYAACTSPTNDAKGVTDVALVLLLYLADYTTEKVTLLSQLIILSLNVGQCDLKCCLLGLKGGFVLVEAFDGAEEDCFLAIALFDHIAEPGVVDSLAAISCVEGYGGGGSSDQGKFETWGGSTAARNADKRGR